MRIINLLLLVSLCCIVAAKYLPDESVSRTLVRNVRSSRNELRISQDSQSNESNDDDNDEDSDDDSDDDKNASLEKRQQIIEKFEKKRAEELHKLQEKREKEERKRRELLEKEQREKEKLAAKFEEEKRKLEEKLKKEERKRKEKIEKEERKRAEKLAETERKLQEKIAKEELKRQKQLSKKFESLSKETVLSQSKPMDSIESEEDMDFEDLWKNYVYEKYGLSPNSTDVEKNAAVNRYMQEVLGLNTNSTKAEYHQAVLQLVQNQLAVQQSASSTQSGFQNYLTSHLNAIYLQKLQLEIENKIAELENDTVLLENVSLPWVPQAKHTIQQKKTILTSIAQYLSGILPNWITGNNSSSNVPVNADNPSSMDLTPSNTASEQPTNGETVSNSNIITNKPTLDGININNEGISTNTELSSNTATNIASFLDYNNPESIGVVVSSNDDASISIPNAVLTEIPSNVQWSGDIGSNGMVTSESTSSAGSVIEESLTNNITYTSEQHSSSNYTPTTTGLNKPSIVIDTAADEPTHSTSSSSATSTGVGISSGSSDSASVSTQSGLPNIISIDTEVTDSLVSSGTDMNAIASVDVENTNVNELVDSNIFSSNVNIPVSSTPIPSPTTLNVPAPDITVVTLTNNIEASSTDAVASTNLDPSETGTGEAVLTGTETVSTSGVEISIEQSVSGWTNTGTVDTPNGVGAPVTSLDSTIGIGSSVDASPDIGSNTYVSPALDTAITINSTVTDTEEGSPNSNSISTATAVETSVDISSGVETSPNVNEIVLDNITNTSENSTDVLSAGIISTGVESSVAISTDSTSIDSAVSSNTVSTDFQAELATVDSGNGSNTHGSPAPDAAININSTVTDTDEGSPNSNSISIATTVETSVDISSGVETSPNVNEIVSDNITNVSETSTDVLSAGIISTGVESSVAISTDSTSIDSTVSSNAASTDFQAELATVDSGNEVTSNFPALQETSTQKNISIGINAINANDSLNIAEASVANEQTNNVVTVATNEIISTSNSVSTVVNDAVTVEPIPNDDAVIAIDNSINPIESGFSTNLPQTILSDVIPLASDTVVNIADVSTVSESDIGTASNVISTDAESAANESVANDVALTGTDSSLNLIEPASNINTLQINVSETVLPSSETPINVINGFTATEEVTVTSSNSVPTEVVLAATELPPNDSATIGTGSTMILSEPASGTSETQSTIAEMVPLISEAPVNVEDVTTVTEKVVVTASNVVSVDAEIVATENVPNNGAAVGIDSSINVIESGSSTIAPQSIVTETATLVSEIAVNEAVDVSAATDSILVTASNVVSTNDEAVATEFVTNGGTEIGTDSSINPIEPASTPPTVAAENISLASETLNTVNFSTATEKVTVIASNLVSTDAEVEISEPIISEGAAVGIDSSKNLTEPQNSVPQTVATESTSVAPEIAVNVVVSTAKENVTITASNAVSTDTEVTATESKPNASATTEADSSLNTIQPGTDINAPQTNVTEVIPLASEIPVNVVDVSTATETVTGAASNIVSTDVETSTGTSVDETSAATIAETAVVLTGSEIVTIASLDGNISTETISAATPTESYVTVSNAYVTDPAFVNVNGSINADPTDSPLSNLPLSDNNVSIAPAAEVPIIDSSLSSTGTLDVASEIDRTTDVILVAQDIINTSTTIPEDAGAVLLEVTQQ